MENDAIDYEGLFEVIRKENERLRMKIVSLKDNGYTFTDRIGDIWDKWKEHPLFILYLFMGLSILFQCIPLLTAWMKGCKREE
jgi:hypothetical protein